MIGRGDRLYYIGLKPEQMLIISPEWTKCAQGSIITTSARIVCI